MLKRYILFIALSFLVFWLYAMLLPPRPPVRRTPTEAPQEKGAAPAVEEEQKATPEEVPKKETEIAAAPGLIKPEVTWEMYEAELREGKTSLENDYCKIIFTRYGGAIRELLLKTIAANKRVVIQGKEPVRIPPPGVRRLVEEVQEELRLNPLVMASRSWACPDHPDVRANSPGNCPRPGCQKGLIEVEDGAEFGLSSYTFELKEAGERKVAYQLLLPGRIKITKAFELAKDDYLLTLDVSFENLSEEKRAVPCHQVEVGTVFPVSPKAGYKDITFIVQGRERIHSTEKLRKLSAKPRKPEEEKLEEVEGERLASVGWASAGNKYFALILAPEEEDRKVGNASVPVDKLIRRVKRSLSSGSLEYLYSLGIGVKQLELKANEKIVHRYFFYAGPKEYDRLKRLSQKLSGDRQFERVMGFGWFSFVGIPLVKILKACYKVVPNYGLAIMFLTILIKVVLYPLDQKSYKSMKEMQKIQPLIAEAKKKYKDDPRRGQVEQMKLFKEHKVNPFGGCLPMLLQMPVLIAMFGMLRSAVELWRAPFVLWIKDLSEPDVLVDFHAELPILGHLSLNILPLILIGTFILQNRISKMGATPVQQDPQQKAMGRIMTIFFGIIFYNMPSGLTLYFAVSTVLRSLQQYFVQRKG